MKAKKVVGIVALFALLVAACSTAEESSPRVEAGQQPEATQPVATVPADEERPTPLGTNPLCGITLNLTYHLYTDVESLAWVSQQVVGGTVVEQEVIWGAFVAPDFDPAERYIYTDSVVAVDTQVRGYPATAVRVRQIGGTIGDCAIHNTEDTLKVGDQVVLFLEYENPEARSAGGDTYWVVGGASLGRWPVVNGKALPPSPQSHLVADEGIDLEVLLQRIEDTLDSGTPPPGLPEPLVIPLSEAPITSRVPAEPTESQPSAIDPTCDYGISDAIEQIDTIDQLAWYSHQIVVGTVTEKLESRKVSGSGPTPEVDYYIVTDYVIDVEDRLRGSDDVASDQTVIVQSWGGTVDGCTQTWDGWPPFEIGDRALFFLRDFEETDQPVAYDIFGRHQGYWAVDEAGFAAPPGAVHLLPNGQPVPVDQLTDQVRDSLTDGPPDDTSYLRDWHLVPLDEAPIVTDTPEPAP